MNQKQKEWEEFYELTRTMDGQYRPKLRIWIEGFLEKQRNDLIKEIEEDYIRYLLEIKCDGKYLIDWFKAKEKAEVKDMQRWS